MNTYQQSIPRTRALPSLAQLARSLASRCCASWSCAGHVRSAGDKMNGDPLLIRYPASSYLPTRTFE